MNLKTMLNILSIIQKLKENEKVNSNRKKLHSVKN